MLWSGEDVSMTMPATNSALWSPATLLILLLLVFPLQGVNCSSRFLLSSLKERLGSTPPSCHNKCSQCNPCFPVQIPAFLAQDNRMRNGKTVRSTEVDIKSFREFSDYKPLGWKCQCHKQLYNP